ncbi:MAG: cysteine--tRNA ligase [Patescibacteria group bacterium]
MDLKLFNTLTRRKETFKPLKAMRVGMYTCGPTVYQYAHIGNLRAYIFADVLRRTLEYNGFSVQQIMNITDVGHLTSDADEGEDKVEKSAIESKTTVEEITDKYTKAFQEDIKLLNIQEPSKWVKASEHIKEQIALVKKLEKKGFTYKTSDGIYYDTSKFKDYGAMAKLDLAGLQEGARVEKNLEKKNLTDFALWKFALGKKRLMEWDSPWGRGFPGWHLECSAMSMKYLGERFDIHTGGVDHVPVHHTNEIAQNYGATGQQVVRFWLHNAFLNLDMAKMAKSLGNIFIIRDLMAKKFNPLSFRYLNLLAHYRQTIEFSLESLTASQNALDNLYDRVRNMTAEPKTGCADYEKQFNRAINDDLNTAQALAVVWEMMKSDNPDSAKLKSLYLFDKVLGLGLEDVVKEKIDIPAEVKVLINERDKARVNKDFAEADRLRNEIAKAGFIVEDSNTGQRVKKA